MLKHKKLKVLYFCSRLPGTIQGGLDLRVRGQITGLLGISSVSVFALTGNSPSFDSRIQSWHSSHDEEISLPISPLEVLQTLKQGNHPFAHKFSTQTAQELKHEIRRFEPDYVIMSRIDLCVYLDAIRDTFDGQIILDLDESVISRSSSILGIITSKGHALALRLFSESVWNLEVATINEVDQVWVSSEIERQRIIDRSTTSTQVSEKVSVIPNSIDIEKYTPTGSLENFSNTVIFPGFFAYEPNIDAAKFLIDEIMPLIPSVHLKIIGSHIPDWIRNAEKDNVTVLGPVVDIVPHLHAARALVVPLRAGAGTRLKVIEALAAGLPVVSTPFGVEGLGLLPQTDYLEAQTAEEFTDACRMLLSNPELSTALSKRGKETALRKFSIPSLEIVLRAALDVQHSTYHGN